MKHLSKSKSHDLHKNYLQIAVMNKEGRVLRNSKIDNNLKQIGAFFNDIDDKAHVVMESSSVWYNICRQHYNKNSTHINSEQQHYNKNSTHINSERLLSAWYVRYDGRR